MNLIDAGVPEEGFDKIIEEGSKYRRLLEKTPKPLTREDIEEVVEKVFRVSSRPLHRV